MAHLTQRVNTAILLGTMLNVCVFSRVCDDCSVQLVFIDSNTISSNLVIPLCCHSRAIPCSSLCHIPHGVWADAWLAVRIPVIESTCLSAASSVIYSPLLVTNALTVRRLAGLRLTAEGSTVTLQRFKECGLGGSELRYHYFCCISGGC